MEAQKCEVQLLKGGILVAVRCETPQQAEGAKQVLVASGAQDVRTSRETSAEGHKAA
jgi:hypothetical protein